MRLVEEDSFLVQTSLPVTIGQAQGTRTLSFEVLPQFDNTSVTTVGGDRFLVYLVDPANPLRGRVFARSCSLRAQYGTLNVMPITSAAPSTYHNYIDGEFWSSSDKHRLSI